MPRKGSHAASDTVSSNGSDGGLRTCIVLVVLSLVMFTRACARVTALASSRLHAAHG